MANYVYKTIGTCKHCGKRFVQDRADQKYCNNECRAEYYRAIKKKPKAIGICQQCGKEFEKSRVDQKYCCYECGKTAHNRRQAQQMREYTQKPKPKKQEKKKTNWDEIARICRENGCTYGQAVARGLI